MDFIHLLLLTSPGKKEAFMRDKSLSAKEDEQFRLAAEKKKKQNKLLSAYGRFYAKLRRKGIDPDIVPSAKLNKKKKRRKQ
jgi:DNA/RNA-binding domain of Phe-tRNA-synthetase-like protein